MLSDYCGATSRLDPAAGIALSPDSWGWQVKRDGCYARVTLDGAGRISSLLSRAGRQIAAGADLVGIRAGLPDSVLHGELEAHTEAGIAAAARSGFASLHLFDATRIDGRDVSRLPYVERHGMIYASQSVVETDGDARRHTYRVDAHGDAHGRGGRYCRAVPRDLRRLPVVPIVRGRDGAAALWRDHVELGGGEGLVAVRLSAPAGARAAKRKIKATDTIDGVVLSADTSAIRVAAQVIDDTARGPRRRTIEFAMPAVAPVGSIVEVRCDGWYASGLPRFPRLVRSRGDLSAVQ